MSNPFNQCSIFSFSQNICKAAKWHIYLCHNVKFQIMKQTLVVNRLKNPLDLIELSRKGLSRAAVDLVAKKLSLSDRDMSRILNISERTFHRYSLDTQLDTSSTERLLKLMLLYQHGEEVFSTLDDFKPWMKQSMRIFGDKSALDLLDTITGFELVDNVLSRIEFGTYS